jgi:Nitrate and nitrite sensing/ANTAR domain
MTGSDQVADNQPNMTPATSEFILRARQLDLQAMQHLATRVSLVQVIGQLVHDLQWERGVTSIYLASGGQRFEAERDQAVTLSSATEATLKHAFAEQLQANNGASSQMIAMMGWVRLDLDTLLPFRAAIAQKAPRAGDAVAAFSRVIAGLIELVFQLADGATDPATSRLLVALVHLFQVKEEAGQERAVGAHLLASGVCTEMEQQRFIHLIDAQERAAEVLLAFVDSDLRQRWDSTHGSANMAQLERLRRTLCMAKVSQPLDATQSKTWFDVSSARIADLRELELVLEKRLQASCTASIVLAQQELADSTGLVQRLLQNPSTHAQAVQRYYSEEGQPASVPVLTKAQPQASSEAASSTETTTMVASLQDLLQKQSTKLAHTEQELLKAKQAINERKVIERAKGALMQRLGMTEEAAYRALQKAAMDHNKRLLDVAEATLALSDMALAAGAQQDTAQ